jgi:hypothetical protein
MQRRSARVSIGAMAWLGSTIAAFLGSPVSADTRALPHAQGAPVRINGYISAGSELPSPDEFYNGPSKLRRDASQAPPSHAADSGAFFLDVRHDETK